jgi:hypothetical protein
MRQLSSPPTLTEYFTFHLLTSWQPFIEEIVRTMRKITCDLSPQQVHTFYEACGYMIAAQPQKNSQERLIAELMSYPNAAWDAIIQQATATPSILQDADTIKVIGNVMKTNVSACSSIGSYFYPQIGRIYLDMLSMYRATSQMISEAVQRDGKFQLPVDLLVRLTESRRRCDQDAKSKRAENDQEGDSEAYRDLCRKS